MIFSNSVFLSFCLCVHCVRYSSPEPNQSAKAARAYTPLDIAKLGAVPACDEKEEISSLKWPEAQSSWPVVREHETNAPLCLKRGTITANTPVLVDTPKRSASLCGQGGEGYDGFVQDDETYWTEVTKKRMFDNRWYFVIEPPAGSCTKSNPCGLTLTMDGVGDHGHAYPEHMPLFMALATDTKCRESLRNVLIFPQLPKGESWEDTSWQPIEDYVVPLTKKILAEYSNIDHDRVFISGLSDGGTAAVLAAIGYPDMYAAAMGSALVLGPDRCGSDFGGGWDEPANNSHLFTAMAQRRHARLASTTPWKLKTMAVSKGSRDTKDMDRYLGKLIGHLTNSDLVNRVSIQVRVYHDAGHGTWKFDTLAWPGLWSVTMSGTTSLTYVGPVDSTWPTTLEQKQRDDTPAQKQRENGLAYLGHLQSFCTAPRVAILAVVVLFAFSAMLCCSRVDTGHLWARCN